jgi:uncharacterized protein (TIGR03435 family)
MQISVLLRASLAAAVLASMAIYGQNPSRSEFEVASIKLADFDMTKIASQVAAGQMPRMGKHVSQGTAEYLMMSLQDLITEAYQVKPYQITGPNWLNT